MHAVGMCDEYPRINHGFRGPAPYDGVVEPGMVLCIESYIGAVGERDGVKFEEQVLVTEDGCEPISTYPKCAALMDSANRAFGRAMRKSSSRHSGPTWPWVNVPDDTMPE